MINISIIIPVFNSEAFLSRCIDSVINQTLSNIEIIIIDDCSQDSSKKIISEYMARDNRIKCISHKENKGLLKSRITGIQHAHGKYILHLDSDDTIAHFTCKKAFCTAEKHNADIVSFTVKYGKTESEMSQHFGTRNHIVLHKNEILEDFLQQNMWWMSGGKLLRTKTVIQALSLLNIADDQHINQNEDLILYFPLCCVAQKYVASPKSGIYYYFINENSLTKNSFSSLEKWQKICSDLSAARQSVLHVAEAMNLSQNQIMAMERFFAANFRWYIQQITDLPRHLQAQYASLLLDTIRAGVAVDTAGKDFFSLLCATVPYKKMKRAKKITNIAIFSCSLSGGGAERVAYLLAILFLQANYNIIIVTSQLPPKDSYINPSQNVRFEILENSPYRSQYIELFLAKNNIDICIFNDHWIEENFYDVLVTQLCCTSTICIEHNIYFFPLFADHISLFRLRNSVYRNTDTLICLSPCHTDMWRAAGFSQAQYIPNPLTFNQTNCARTLGKTPTVLFVGRICLSKGIFDALHVFAYVHKSIPSARLVVLGRFCSDEDKQKVMSLAKKLNITCAVDFKGHISNVENYYCNARVHIMPSRYEGAPMVLFEAKAHGVPSVLYSMPYLDAATEEYGCLMVAKADIEGMAKAVIRLLQDDVFWQNMSDKALQSLDRFSNERILKDWQELFQRLTIPPYNHYTANNRIDLAAIIMQEFNAAISTIDIFSTGIPRYLQYIEKTVNIVFPKNSLRRSVCKKTAKLIFKYLNIIRKRLKITL